MTNASLTRKGQRTMRRRTKPTTLPPRVTYDRTVDVGAHHISEWQRLADQAYARGFNFWGTRYSVAAAVWRNRPCPVALYDGLMYNYRVWLVVGFQADGSLVWP